MLIKTENVSFLSMSLCVFHTSLFLHLNHQPLDSNLHGHLSVTSALCLFPELLQSLPHACWFPSSLEATRCHGNAFRMHSSMFMSDVALGVSTSILCALRASAASRALSYVRVPLLQWMRIFARGV